MGPMRASRVVSLISSVLLGSLLLLWAIGLVASVSYRFRIPNGRAIVLYAIGGSLEAYALPYSIRLGGQWIWQDLPNNLSEVLGQFAWDRSVVLPSYRVACPICVLVTALLPIAIGARTGFQFPLWMWLAYTGLIAAQCAYFLR